jgi:hypothetical protein
MEFDSIRSFKDEGFHGFMTISHLIDSNCGEVPETKGAYLVINEFMKKTFLPENVGGHFKDKNPTVPISELERNWVDNTMVLYIGKAGSTGKSATLKSRIRQYMRFGQGIAVGHRGGRYIWQLANNRELMLCWKTLIDIDPREYERKQISEFKKIYGKYPFANLQK